MVLYRGKSRGRLRSVCESRYSGKVQALATLICLLGGNSDSGIMTDPKAYALCTVYSSQGWRLSSQLSQELGPPWVGRSARIPRQTHTPDSACLASRKRSMMSMMGTPYLLTGTDTVGTRLRTTLNVHEPGFHTLPLWRLKFPL